MLPQQQYIPQVQALLAQLPPVDTQSKAWLQRYKRLSVLSSRQLSGVMLLESQQEPKSQLILKIMDALPELNPSSSSYSVDSISDIAGPALQARIHQYLTVKGEPSLVPCITAFKVDLTGHSWFARGQRVVSVCTVMPNAGIDLRTWLSERSTGKFSRPVPGLHSSSARHDGRQPGRTNGSTSPRSLAAASVPSSFRNPTDSANGSAAWTGNATKASSLATFNIRPGGSLPDMEVFVMFLQMVTAVDAVHRAGFVHRNVRLSSFMIDDDGRVRLAGWGAAFARGMTPAHDLSHLMGQNQAAAMAALALKSPEELDGARVTIAADWWCLGLLLYCLGCMDPKAWPFKVGSGWTRTELQHVQHTLKAAISAGVMHWPPSISSEIRSMVTRLLNPDPEQRIMSISGLVSARHRGAILGSSYYIPDAAFETVAAKFPDLAPDMARMLAQRYPSQVPRSLASGPLGYLLSKDGLYATSVGGSATANNAQQAHLRLSGKADRMLHALTGALKSRHRRSFSPGDNHPYSTGSENRPSTNSKSSPSPPPTPGSPTSPSSRIVISPNAQQQHITFKPSPEPAEGPVTTIPNPMSHGQGARSNKNNNSISGLDGSGSDMRCDASLGGSVHDGSNWKAIGRTNSGSSMAFGLLDSMAFHRPSEIGGGQLLVAPSIDGNNSMSLLASDTSNVIRDQSVAGPGSNLDGPNSETDVVSGSLSFSASAGPRHLRKPSGDADGRKHVRKPSLDADNILVSFVNGLSVRTPASRGRLQRVSEQPSQGSGEGLMNMREPPNVGHTAWSSQLSSLKPDGDEQQQADEVLPAIDSVGSKAASREDLQVRHDATAREGENAKRGSTRTSAESTVTDSGDPQGQTSSGETPVITVQYPHKGNMQYEAASPETAKQTTLRSAVSDQPAVSASSSMKPQRSSGWLCAFICGSPE